MGFLAPALPFLAAGSAVMGAVGQIQQSRAQSAAAGYNAKVAAINADTERQNAGFAAAEGEQQAGTQGLKTAARVGATLADQGASNIDVNSKSFSDVRTSEAMLGKLDAMQIRSNAARQAYGFQTGATSYENQGTLDRAQAKNARSAGNINAATTILGGVSQAAMYSNFLSDTDPTHNLTGIVTHGTDAEGYAPDNYNPKYDW